MSESRSDSVSPSQSRAFLVPIVLAILFALGLFLAYSAKPPQSTSPGSAGTAHRASSKPDSQESGSLAADKSDTRLAESQQRIQELEQAMEAMKAAQASVLDRARDQAAEQIASLERQHRDALERAERSATAAQEAAQNLARDYSALGACYSERGILVTLAEPELRFAPGQASLPSPQPKELDALGGVLQRNPALQVQIAAYTENRRKAAKSSALSAQRAEAVKQALLSRGIDSGRVQAEGMGEANPVAISATDAGRRGNPRIEIRLIEAP